MGKVEKGGRKGAKPKRGVSQNVTEKSPWTEQKELAAQLAAEDRLSDELIAAEVGVERRTLARWKLTQEFKARRAQIVEEMKAALLAQGIAAKQNRLDALDDRHERMRAVIEARAEEHKDYAGGGATGLLVRQLKVIGKGEDAREVEEYEVDTALLRELREHEKQAAIEVGEWTEKSDVKHAGEFTFRVVYSDEVKGGCDR